MIFVALRSVSSILPSTKLLFKNLTATDYTVGLIAKPILAIYIVLDSVAKMNSNILASVLKVYKLFLLLLFVVFLSSHQPLYASIDCSLYD